MHGWWKVNSMFPPLLTKMLNVVRNCDHGELSNKTFNAQQLSEPSGNEDIKHMAPPLAIHNVRPTAKVWAGYLARTYQR